MGFTRVSAIPHEAVKEGDPLPISGNRVSQSYRLEHPQGNNIMSDDSTLYEQITYPSGAVVCLRWDN